MDTKKVPWLILPLFFLCYSLEPHFSFAADTIFSNQSLSGDGTIVSKSGVFELGFFKPGNSTNYYVGMWYKMANQPNTVWVANREKPVRDINSSVLKIVDGNLVLFNESQIPIWSTNVRSTNSISAVAVLLDDGNLVLRQGPNSSTILWQSFDHPADTWLPGMKLSFNKRTNQSQRFTAWKNQDDPAPGFFSLEIDPSETNQVIFVWNRSQQYWSTGPWDGQTKSFNMVPEMRMLYLAGFIFNHVSNENESYFTYSFSTNFVNKDFVISRSSINASGQFVGTYWLTTKKDWTLYFSQPKQQCDVYGYCGAFGSCNDKSRQFCNCLTGFQPASREEWNQQLYSGGCTRQAKLQCENADSRGDQFLEIRMTTFPTNPQNVAADGIKECRSTCLNNCSCTAYAYNDNECSIWIGDLLNLKQLGEDDDEGKTLHIRLAYSEFSSPTNKKKLIIVAVAVSSGLVLLGLTMFIIKRRWRTTIIPTNPTENSLMAFGYKDLQKATNNFSEKLGKGGFGSVFKGTLPDGSLIAVKKLEGINQGEKQFRTEVSIVGVINHVNLIRLRGFCSEGSRKLLVYDYLPNGSLDKHLFHAKDSEVLDWKTRYQITLGAARGLAYLHDKCRDSIIHCDMKPENILLDGDFCPKVADFGLAKLIGREFSRVLTSLRGTMGYLAPEWISGQAITPKADVYSYGMMILEIVSGRRNFQVQVQDSDDEGSFFPATVAIHVSTEGGDVLNLLDSRLNGNVNVEELSRICTVACWCIQDDEFQRPTMSQVVQILEGVSEVSQPPIPRFLQACIKEHSG